MVNSSLCELFNTSLEGYPIAGVQDIKKKMVRKNPTYVNAGMLIFDINKMRDLDLESKFLKWTQENHCHIRCGDQEIINEVLKTKHFLMHINDGVHDTEVLQFCIPLSYLLHA